MKETTAYTIDSYCKSVDTKVVVNRRKSGMAVVSDRKPTKKKKKKSRIQHKKGAFE